MDCKSHGFLLCNKVCILWGRCICWIKFQLDLVMHFLNIQLAIFWQVTQNYTSAELVMKFNSLTIWGRILMGDFDKSDVCKVIFGSRYQWFHWSLSVLLSYSSWAFEQDASLLPGWLWDCKCLNVGSLRYIITGISGHPERKLYVFLCYCSSWRRNYIFCLTDKCLITILLWYRRGGSRSCEDQEFLHGFNKCSRVLFENYFGIFSSIVTCRDWEFPRLSLIASYLCLESGIYTKNFEPFNMVIQL